MSQIYKNQGSSGPLPPSVPTQFNTDNGNAVPAANILIVHATDSSENEADGIISKGGVVGTGTSNEMDIVLTNRVRGAVTTTDAIPTNIISFVLSASAGVYEINGSVVGFDHTDVAGASYGFFAGVRTTGAAASLISTSVTNNFSESAMSTATIVISVSGNNLNIVVTGIAGKTITWDALFTYRLVA